MSLPIRQQHPMQLVQRMHFLQYLKEIGVGKISQLPKKFHVFLEEFEDGSLDFDWHFAIFEATEYQYETLLENFVPKKKRPSNLAIPVSSLETVEEVEKPSLEL